MVRWAWSGLAYQVDLRALVVGVDELAQAMVLCGEELVMGGGGR